MSPDDRGKGRALRPLTPDDLLCLEELGDAALSPDGQWLAYVLKRPRATATFHKHDLLSGNDRGDVWIAATSGGVPRNLTNGGDDGAGHWAPTWSPDSERLALLSTRGGNVHVWVYDVRSERLGQLCERAADLDSHAAPMVWTSDREILVATLPDGERPARMTVELRAAEVAMRAWPKAWKGLEATASVLDSGVPAPFEQRPQGRLVLVDAVTGHQETVMSGFFRDLRIAPDGRHVACVRQVDVTRPHASRKLERRGLERGRLAILTADGDVVTGGVQEIERPLSTSLRWSPDGTELALIGGGPSPGSSRRIFRYRLADGRVRAVTGEALHPTSIAWTAGGGMLALAEPAKEPAEEQAQRADWWLVEGEHEPRKLSADLSTVPAQLVAEEGRQAFVGLADGDVVRLSLSDRRWANLTEGFEPRIVWLLWPSRRTSDDQTFDRLLLAVDDATARDWYSLDLRSGELSPLPAPSTAGWLADFAPEHATTVPVVVDRTGARLWLSSLASERHSVIVETNTWLADIAEGEIRRVDYRGLDGSELRAWLILPVGYEQGSRCPLVAWVYPGFVFAGETPPMLMLSIAGHHAHNPQLLAARGYAVLLPSMPLTPEAEPSDPCMELTNGVLPALDKAIELGIADPDRLGLIGHSFGGYGAYGLVTRTHRFRAAVVLAGLADLVSVHGQFDARFRYDAHPHEHMLQMSLVESGQLRMGGPPWQDPDRYVRNSPLFQVDRVLTPVLIIQGDMDYVPLQQGEQVFSALYRQGKRARFVRYWGEGHVFQSPANIRDSWQQIYGWFDEFLKPAGDAVS